MSSNVFCPLKCKQSSWKLGAASSVKFKALSRFCLMKNPCWNGLRFLACSASRPPHPIPVPFSMSYPPDWYYQLHYTAVNSPWKWLGPFGGADVFQSPHHWLCPKLQSPSSPSPPPSFAPPRVWQQQREAGGRGGAEGGGGGCNWRLETCYPSRCPHQPISILSAVQSRRSIKKTRRLTCIWI